MGEKCSWTVGEYKREAKSKWINDHISTSNCSPISGSQPTQENHEFTLKQTAFIWMWEHYLEIFFDSITCMTLSLLWKEKKNRGKVQDTPLGATPLVQSSANGWFQAVFYLQQQNPFQSWLPSECTPNQTAPSPPFILGTFQKKSSKAW